MSRSYAFDRTDKRWYSLVLNWLTPVFDTAAIKPITEEDAPLMPSDCDCEYNMSLLRMYWLSHPKDSWQRYRSSIWSHRWLKTGSLVPALANVYGWEFVCLVPFKLVCIVFTFAGPILLRKLVSITEDNYQLSTVLGYVALLFLSRVGVSVLDNRMNYLCNQIKVSVVAAMKGCLYHKILNLSTESRRAYTAGSISNLYVVDIDRVSTMMINLHYMWALPLQIIIGMVLLYEVVSLAMFAGLGTIVMVLVVNNYIAGLQKKENDEVMKHKDERLKHINELLASMLTIKLNAWEAKFSELIMSSRSVELIHIWKYLNINAVIICLFWMVPSLVSVVTIFVYVKLLGNDISASRIFSALSLFRLLQEPLRFLPNLINQLFQAMTSVERLQEFYVRAEKKILRSDNHFDQAVGSILCPKSAAYTWQDPDSADNKVMDTMIGRHGEANPSSKSLFALMAGRVKTLTRISDKHGHLRLVSSDIRNSEGDEDEGIAMLSSTRQMTEHSFSLTFKSDIIIKPRCLVVVKGGVGCGKSSLIWALLGEMYPLPGSAGLCTITGSVSYVSQQPWVQNMSIRDNIIFGQPFEYSWYCEVVQACCLNMDFANLPDGDLTVIGEKGTNLSGGQKARVSLARAVYRRADVIILDDVLSALDPAVALSVFNECILGILKGSTRILATHDLVALSSKDVDVLITVKDGVAAAEVIEQQDSKVETTLHHNGRMLHETAGIDANLPAGKQANANIEERAHGQVDSAIYMHYLNALGGLKFIVVLCCVQITWQSLSISSDVFLSNWSKQSSLIQHNRVDTNLVWYSLLALGSGSIVLCRTTVVSWSGYAAARNMFEQVMQSLLRASMAWYDKNPSGRILNRLSDDQTQVDVSLPFAVGSIFATGFALGGDLITVTVLTKYLIFFLLPFAAVYRRTMNLYLGVSREAQRMQRGAQSPVLSLMAESSVGLVTIRSFGHDTVNDFQNRHSALVNAHTKLQFLNNVGRSWFVIRIQCIGALILLASSLLAILGTFLSPGFLGLCLTYSLNIANGLQNIIEHISTLENSMVCPERLLQYAFIPPEGTLDQKASFADESKSITTNGTTTLLNKGIVFDNVWFRYQPDGEYVLKGISFEIPAGSKVGIVGRTGSGKSSLTMSLFRIAELSCGQIYVDGCDISSMELLVLRNLIEIVPQLPVVFKGTVRNYLDPFNNHSDPEIWTALDKAQLSGRFRSGIVDEQQLQNSGLNFPLEENGSNISVGERQLLVLARALLRKSKILIMDEATASVDYATECQIQHVLSTEFRYSTVLCIAHRVRTIANCDIILVIDDGKVLECGPPKSLKHFPAGTFDETS